MKKIITLLTLFSIAASAQNTFTDPRDGKTYKTVKMGKQTWMAQNLDYHGDDGYLGLCYGDDPKKGDKNPENCQKYGRLYDWSEAMKACPKGWHLPSNKEWQTLVDFAGGDEVAGKKLKAKNEWNSGCKSEEMDDRGRVTVINNCGTDEYGFSALPGGLGNLYTMPYNAQTSVQFRKFEYVGDGSFWWSSSSVNNPKACLFGVGSYSESALISCDEGSKKTMASVRCLQN